MVTKIITAVIPAFSDINIVNNSVIALCRQWIPADTFELEIIIVNDNISRPDQYDSFLSDQFSKLINPHISIRIIKNDENVGQGQSRNIGIKAAKSDYIVLCDEDDSYAVNAVYRFWEVLEKEYCAGNDPLPISVIGAPLYGFDKGEFRQLIPSNSIWVNSKLYNRKFLEKHNVWFPDGYNSHRSEDYPFIRSLDYAIAHDKTFKRIDFSEQADTFYWWIPNYNSRSRCDEHYGSLLAGYTMKSSSIIFDYMTAFNKANNIEDQEDEYMKHEILNMCIYSFYNYLWFLKDLSQGWDDCQEEYWEVLREGVAELLERLRVYWDEIVPSDVADTLYAVKHHSDCRFIESWIGSFEKFVTQGHWTLSCNFSEIKEYCKTLEFDAAMHEIHASYVTAWQKRHIV